LDRVASRVIPKCVTAPIPRHRPATPELPNEPKKSFVSNKPTHPAPTSGPPLMQVTDFLDDPSELRHPSSSPTSIPKSLRPPRQMRHRTLARSGAHTPGSCPLILVLYLSPAIILRERRGR